MPNNTVRAAAEGMPKAPISRTFTPDVLYAHTDVLYPKARELQRKLYILMRMLENSLDVNRGTVKGTNVTLQFQVEGLDVMGWLSGQVWSDATDLSELLEKMIAQIEVAS